ncbi:MAG: hypothetical protein AAFX76_14620 [Planctomycetota bacterium]
MLDELIRSERRTTAMILSMVFIGVAVFTGLQATQIDSAGAWWATGAFNLILLYVVVRAWALTKKRPNHGLQLTGDAREG